MGMVQAYGAMVVAGISLVVGTMAKAETDVALTIIPTAEHYSRIEDIVLKIEIRNTSDKIARFMTIDKEPPLNVSVLDDRGRNRLTPGEAIVKSGKSLNPKDHTRNIEFILGPGEVKAYQVNIDVLLSKSESLKQLGQGKLQLIGMLPRVRYENGQYIVELIKSEAVSVSIAR
jgi:hypothetical protein